MEGLGPSNIVPPVEQGIGSEVESTRVRSHTAV